MLNNTELYDSTKHVGVVERVTEMINTMRRRKGLNEWGTYRTLQSRTDHTYNAVPTKVCKRMPEGSISTGQKNK